MQGRRHCGSGVGDASQNPPFSGVKYLFLCKIGVEEREELDKKGDKIDIRRRACSQKSDVTRTNSSMYLFL